ncbi:glycosyltransferase family 2 protein [Limobrevibacterium gyesilva]|uniref:Glycosyltransferase family 2 protein n=1 Tax=Limobrevibacterium gyesilva TaxID=2991712 RepID=A0AA41YMA1_9PROT|nr:glycosyltransferase family A protein [Limobrevibacterium gyesilva]MCW3476511.1 glycosyltransferase family 2 protein [Limobrevibacterium gyesilva]
MAASTAPAVDVNLFVFNGEKTIADAIECIAAQTWPNLRLTVIDNGSTDRTTDIVAGYARRLDWVRLTASRVNTGAVLNCQRAFWHGDADFVMPKTADDILAPDFVERVMAVLLAHPDCAMCHAGGLVFSGAGTVHHVYPEAHRLAAVGPDPVDRAVHVMTRYTSAPSFWGIYRRDAVNRLSRIPYRAGWDHAVLAELALYGEIRHVPELLFWRRDGGKDVGILARSCTASAQRGLAADDALADLRWTTPLITTAYAHIEVFALARVDEAARRRLLQDARRVFRGRWLPGLRQEAAAFRSALPDRIARLAAEDGVPAMWMARHLADAMTAIETMLPEVAFTAERLEIAMLAAHRARMACGG